MGIRIWISVMVGTIERMSLRRASQLTLAAPAPCRCWRDPIMVSSDESITEILFLLVIDMGLIEMGLIVMVHHQLLLWLGWDSSSGHQGDSNGRSSSESSFFDGKSRQLFLVELGVVIWIYHERLESVHQSFPMGAA